MGTCCAAHLAAKIRDYAPNAQNGAVTVMVIENLIRQNLAQKCDHVIGRNYSQDVAISCENMAEFTVSFFQKKE